ncbi:MAG: thiol-activated cytolysin family protein [Capnocytophaga sp.]|nr:thiol-activated cytolysin family protein [Capnocytophaga sp.]
MKSSNLFGMKSTALLFSAMALFSCKKEEGNEPSNGNALNIAQLNSYVKQLPSVKQQAPFAERLATQSSSRTASLFGAPMLDATDTRYYEQAKEYENQLLFTENDEVFYPGALVKSKTVVEGSYSPIIVPRKALTISVSLTGDTPKTTVEKPSLSTMRAAISELLNKNFNAPPANITYNSYEVHDEQHLKLALGASYTGAVNTVKGSTNFKYDKEKTRYIVKIEQVFYTVDVDLPEKASDLFSDDFDYKTQFGEEKPVYISSIKYGRVLLLGIESTLSKIDLEAKINASLLSGKVSADAETAYNELKKSSTITGRIFGGNAKLAGETIGDFSAVRNFLKEGSTWSKENLGVPLSYRLRELGTNNTFKTVIYSKYLKNDYSYVDNKKLDFDLVIKQGELKSPLGEGLSTEYFFIERLNPKSSEQKSPSEDRYDRYGKITKHIIAFEKGERILINVRLKDKKVLTFELPAFEDLVRKAQSSNETNMNDIDNNNGLTIKDKNNNNNTLTIGIHNQKVK